jgi:hypothetical protein
MLFTAAPNRPKVKPPAPSHLIADYPDDVSSVLIESPEWTEIDEVMPSDKGARHALAAALCSGLIPAHTVAQFDGQHADLQLASQRPVLWVCRTKPIPAAPLSVRLHGRNNGHRELHGGRLPAVGAQIMKEKPSDIIPADPFRAEKGVWLIQPKNALQPGEYALMIANDAVGIFPFTISDPAVSSSAPVGSNR